MGLLDGLILQYSHRETRFLIESALIVMVAGKARALVVLHKAEPYQVPAHCQCRDPKRPSVSSEFFNVPIRTKNTRSAYHPSDRPISGLVPKSRLLQ